MKMMPEREAQNRPGRNRWWLGLGLMIALVLLGFMVVLIESVSQPEIVSSDVASEVVPSSIPSPTAQESPAAVLDTPTPTGPLAPDFTLPDLNGTMWSLSQFRGRPVVLFFWATW